MKTEAAISKTEKIERQKKFKVLPPSHFSCHLLYCASQIDQNLTEIY